MSQQISANLLVAPLVLLGHKRTFGCRIVFVGSRLSAPGPQEKRFAAYIEGLANAAGHEDRHAPLKDYCKGLLLPGERKSIEPMAARLDPNPNNTQRLRQSLHHLVAKAPWSDAVMLEQVRKHVLPTMQKQGRVVAWIVDDTGFPKKGKHSVGVTRQYCGQVGKQENCRVAVSLSVTTWDSSLPIAYRLYLPKEWAEDEERRTKTEVPEEIAFQTKPEMALDQIRAAVAADLDRGVVLADAAYGINTEFREGVTALGLQYVAGVQSSMTVWEPGETAIAGQAARETGTTSAATATVHRPPTYLCEAAGDEPALYCFQGNYLAGRHRPEIAVPICSSSRACRSSGLREGGTSRGGVVTDRMAAR